MREDGRISLLLDRDGPEATEQWVRRTTVIYRRAVLARGHFARSAYYRRRFIEAYCDFKGWLARSGR